MIDIIKYNPIKNIDSSIISFSDSIKKNLNLTFDNKYENMLVKFIPNFIQTYSNSNRIVERFIEKNVGTKTVYENEFFTNNKMFLLIVPTSIEHEYKEYRNPTKKEREQNSWKEFIKYKPSETGHFIEFSNNYKIIFCSIDRVHINNFYYMFHHTLEQNSTNSNELKVNSNIEFDDYSVENKQSYNCMSIKLKSTYKIKTKK